MQDFLTFVIEALVIVPFCFILIDIVNQARYFGGYQIPRDWQPPAIPKAERTNTTIAPSAKLIEATPILELKPKAIMPQEETAPTIKTESQVEPVQILASLINFPDPWTLPIEDSSKVLDSREQSVKLEPKPLLLLLPAKVNAISEVDKLLAGIDLNKLPLRTARKVAKVLEIAQKVNKKDVPLSFLRAQIKSKLQQSQVPQEIFATVLELLAS